MKNFIFIALAVLILNSCYYERQISKKGNSPDIKKHVIFTSRDINNKFNPIEVADRVSIPADLNMYLYPRNYYGITTVIAREGVLTMNLLYNSENSDINSMNIYVSYSENFKNSFNNFELSLPQSEYNNLSSVLIGETFINIKNEMWIESMPYNDSIQFDDLGFRDSLFNPVDFKGGFDSMYQVVNPLLDGIKIYKNDDNVLMFSAVLTCNGKKYDIYSQSDPLPLIPIIISAAAGVSAYKYKDEIIEKGKNIKRRFSVFIGKVKDKLKGEE